MVPMDLPSLAILNFFGAKNHQNGHQNGLRVLVGFSKKFTKVYGCYIKIFGLGGKYTVLSAKNPFILLIIFYSFTFSRKMTV